MVDSATHHTDTAAPRSRALFWWRAASIFLALVVMFGAATSVSLYEQFKAQVRHLQGQLSQTSQIRYIAVLLDARHQAALLATFDPKDQALQLQRLNEVKEGREDTMQLWVLSDSGKPRSLGILESKAKTLRLPATEPTLAAAHELAISVEAKGGVAEAHGPSLPYLFKGSVVQKAL